MEAPFAGRPEIAGLVLGMVLGRKYGLTADIERQFQAGGLYHLVVVSGFNLAVVAGTAMLAGPVYPMETTDSTFIRSRMRTGLRRSGGRRSARLSGAVAVLLSIIGRLLDRGNAALNTTAGTAFFLLLMDPGSLGRPELSNDVCSCACRARASEFRPRSGHSDGCGKR